MTMTSTLSRTSAERKSIAMLRLSIQPSSRSRCEKAAIRSRSVAGLAATMNPVVGTFGCCARAASGQAAAPASRTGADCSFDHLVSGHEKLRWYGQAERLRRFQV